MIVKASFLFLSRAAILSLVPFFCFAIRTEYFPFADTLPLYVFFPPVMIMEVFLCALPVTFLEDERTFFAEIRERFLALVLHLLTMISDDADGLLSLFFFTFFTVEFKRAIPNCLFPVTVCREIIIYQYRSIAGR